MTRHRTRRVYALLDYDEAAWAAADVTRVLARTPGDREALEARAYAYDLMGDYAHADNRPASTHGRRPA